MRCKIHTFAPGPELCSFCLQSELEGKSDAYDEAMLQLKQHMIKTLERMIAEAYVQLEKLKGDT